MVDLSIKRLVFLADELIFSQSAYAHVEIEMSATIIENCFKEVIYEQEIGCLTLKKKEVMFKESCDLLILNHSEFNFNLNRFGTAFRLENSIGGRRIFCKFIDWSTRARQ